MSTPALRWTPPYSDDQKATMLATLEACGGDLRKAADMLPVSRRHLARLAKGNHINDHVVSLVQGKKAELADAMETIAHLAAAGNIEAIEALVDEIPTADVSELGMIVHRLTGAAKIGGEMMQLLRGDPTQITGKASTGGLDTYRRKPEAEADTEDANVISEEEDE